MIQSRQFRQTHIDCHYASALFRYQKEFAIKFKEHTVFVSMDDKHTCKVGEPGHPVAAIERRKHVIAGLNESFQAPDHDFTKFSLTASVSLVVDLPDHINGSFYDGQVYVTFKENCFEPSSAIRHMAELDNILGDNNKEILCIYTDWGPDHRCTFESVKMSLISLFLQRDFDMVIAVRTPPYNSWKNPAERVMSICNLGLQAVGLMRENCQGTTEMKLKSCSLGARPFVHV